MRILYSLIPHLRSRWCFRAVFFTLLTVSCGKTTFRGQSDGARLTSPPTTEPESRDSEVNTDEPAHEEVVSGNTPLTGKGVEWFFQCETAPVKLPKQLKNGKSLVEGRGKHRVKRPSDKEMTVHVTGFLCPPTAIDRDITVVVDVSGSAAQTDPVARKSGGFNPQPIRPLQCQRKEAVKALLNQFKSQPEINVGFVTFASEVEFASDSLAPVTLVDGKLATNDSLCRAEGGTNYADALTAAANLLDLGRQGANKEIYFITDGDPSSKEDSRVTAANVRNKALIATIMFGGEDDEHLRTEVASRDFNGQPIHTTVEDAKDLAKALQDLSKTTPVKGTFRYRPLDNQDWREADLWPFVKDGVFDISTLELDPKEFASGLAFSYTYEDNHGTKSTSEGEITWE